VKKKSLLLLLILITIGSLLGCAKKRPVKIIYEKPIITIINDSGITIDVFAKECSQPDSEYLKKVSLDTYTTAKRHSLKEYKKVLYLEEKCYDLKALSTESGLVIGIQKNMTIPPEVRWVLK